MQHIIYTQLFKYIVCPESFLPINIKKKVTDLEQWYLSPLQSTPLGTSHTYPSVPSTFQNNLKSPFSESPTAASSRSPYSHLRSEISSLSMAISVSRKARSRREPNLGCRKADRPGRCDVLPKTSAREMKNGQAHCRDEDASHHLPRAATVFFLLHPSASERLRCYSP